MKILHVVGARPNFMKLAPVYLSLASQHIEQAVVHTGQHYSNNMSNIFFRDLGLPTPDFNLEVGSGSHAEQVAKIMLRFEKVVVEEKPAYVFVYGDVNSTVAAALVSAKLFIPVAHVEAGLRSFDRSMPEELNRLVTDQLSDKLFTPSEDADVNLRREGIPASKIHLVGNVMIDSLVRFLDQPPAPNPDVPAQFGVVTLHRPSNVDDAGRLGAILEVLSRIARNIPLAFPVHPRTRAQMSLSTSILPRTLLLLDPLGYHDFIDLVRRSLFVITDSGGIQEETTFLGIPCLTLRANTERPVTVTLGTNTLIGDDYDALGKSVAAVLDGTYKKGVRPPLWDGKASERITRIILDGSRV